MLLKLKPINDSIDNIYEYVRMLSPWRCLFCSPVRSWVLLCLLTYLIHVYTRLTVAPKMTALNILQATSCRPICPVKI